MKLQVFAVYDSKTEVYGQPNFLINRGAAIRAWQDAANDKQTQIGQHPADFTMFHVAEYDDETGQFLNLHTPVSLGTALEHKVLIQPPYANEPIPLHNLQQQLEGQQ